MLLFSFLYKFYFTIIYENRNFKDSSSNKILTLYVTCMTLYNLASTSFFSLTSYIFTFAHSPMLPLSLYEWKPLFSELAYFLFGWDSGCLAISWLSLFPIPSFPIFMLLFFILVCDYGFQKEVIPSEQRLYQLNFVFHHGDSSSQPMGWPLQCNHYLYLWWINK